MSCCRLRVRYISYASSTLEVKQAEESGRDVLSQATRLFQGSATTECHFARRVRQDIEHGLSFSSQETLMWRASPGQFYSSI